MASAATSSATAPARPTTTTRIKRKPPPSFPYSSRYPPPDPSDPFVPLSVLRSRAHSSSTALDSPDLLGTRPSTADSRASHILFADSPDSRHTSTPSKHAETDAQRPWYGLAKGYLSDAAKPLRPPKSRKRPSQGRDGSAYFSDADLLAERRLTVQAQALQTTQATPRTAPVEPLATPKTKRASVHRRESQYHYRRRSQSVNVNALSPHGGRATDGRAANASESAQYAYDVRQSHGYVFGAVDRLEFIEYGTPEPEPESDGAGAHVRSRSSTQTSTRSSRHPTPPMTPDDTVSSISIASPPHTARGVSPSPPLHDAKPLPVPAALAADTPVNEYSILLPPHAAPATPPDDEALGPLAARVARLPGRSVESDTEATVVESLRRRSRTTSLGEMRRRLRGPGGGRALAGVAHADGAPRRRDTTLSAIIDTSSVSTMATPLEAAAQDAPPPPPPPRAPEPHTRGPQDPPAVPKPKKSLSHVSLAGLRPLPNMSLAPTVAPSANTSIASVGGYGALALTRPDPARAQSVPVPAPPERLHAPEPRRAQTDTALRRSVVQRGYESGEEEEEEEEEEKEEDAVRARAGTPLLPSPLITTRPPPPLPRASSPIPIPKSSKPDVQPHRRASDQSTSPPPRTESPAPRTALAVPVPKAASTGTGSASRAERAERAEVPACYRKPEPLPLSPPPRAKSPIAAHFHAHTPPRADDDDAPAPQRTRSPAPAQSLSRAKGVQDVRRREDDERSQRSSQRSGSRSVEDTGYLPVAQLRPAVSRTATAHSRASVRGAGSLRGRSGSVGGKGQARGEEPDKEETAKPTRAPSAGPPRVRSPEPAVRPPTRAKPPALKDLDSPLPPPPKEFLIRAAAADTEGERSPTPPPRSLASAELASPRPFVSPVQLSASARRAASPPQQPRRQRTVTAPSALARAHDDGADASVHGRACSPALSNGSRGVGQALAEAAARDAHFDADVLPSREQLARAAGLVVVAQNGVRVPFGEVFAERKAVVVFIRHFWCPHCQDYMYSISREVDPEALRRASVDLVVIGNGSPAMIRAYKQIFRMPFQLYTDPTHKVYHALGMTLCTTNPGLEHERGHYVRHGLVGGIAMVVRNALRVGMPVWEKGGDHAQLGGEFVLGPGLTCSYAHRMKNTRSHAPILDVLAAAGVRIYVPPRPTHRNSSEDDSWPRGRAAETREKGRDRDCDDPEYCGEDEMGYDSGRKQRVVAKTTSTSRRHVRDVASELDTDSEREREQLEARRRVALARARAQQQHLKKAPRSYRVANPDRERPHPGRAQSAEKHDAWRPSAKAPQLRDFERDDEAYMLTHEVLAYSFGGNAG